MSDTDTIRALLEAHELIVVEREQAKQKMDDSEWSNGHVNGLNEARNRVEQCILSRVNNLKCHRKANQASAESPESVGEASE